MSQIDVGVAGQFLVQVGSCRQGATVTVQPPGAAGIRDLIVAGAKPVLVEVTPRTRTFTIIEVQPDGQRYLVRVHP